MDWRFALPATAVGVLVSHYCWRTAGLRWSALPAFLGYFLRAAWSGGWDVAKRALHPRPALAPAFVDVPTRLPPGAARLFLAAALSLLPGTLSVKLGAGHIRLHVLDRRQPVEPETARLEARVAALFGLDLDSAGDYG